MYRLDTTKTEEREDWGVISPYACINLELRYPGISDSHLYRCEPKRTLYMIHPTTRKLREIQIAIIENSKEPEDEGMADRIREWGTLDYLVSDWNWKEDPFEHAAWQLLKIATLHPFFQGNKRTAFAVAENILGHYDLFIDATKDEVETFVISVARGEKEIDEVEIWLRDKAEKLLLG